MKSENKLKKLFTINGGDLYSDFGKKSTNFFSKTNLQHIVDVTEIGDHNKGFKIENLSQLFEGLIDSNADSIELIIYMHGGINKGKCAFVTWYHEKEVEIVDVDQFIQALTKATHNIKLNILLYSCRGANFVDYIKDLPIGSKVITISDKDNDTSSNDDDIAHSKIMTQEIFNKDFKLEYLLELHCFNQKIYNNIPTISIVTKEDVITLNLESTKDDYVKSSYLFSSFIEKMFELNIYDKKKFEHILKSLKDHTLEQLKPPTNLQNLVIEHHKQGTSDSLKKEWEQKYYFEGDFNEYNFVKEKDLKDNSDKDTPLMFFVPISEDVGVDAIYSQFSIALGLTIDYAIHNDQLQ